MNSSPGRYAALPGARLFYRDSGGNGVPVIFVHALSGTSESWEPQVDAFTAAGFRVITFDRKGWGRSLADPATGPHGSVAEDIDALATDLKLDRFHLVGIAGGGFITLDYAAWRPERLRGVVVAASTGFLMDAQMREMSRRIQIPNIPEVNLEVGPSYIATNPEGTERWKRIEEHARQPGVKAQELRTPNTFAKLGTISSPMLILTAGADLRAPPKLMKLWAAHIKNHEWVEVFDSGHAMNWEQPDVFNEAVIRFLKKH